MVKTLAFSVENPIFNFQNRLWQYGKQRVLQQPDILYQPLAVPADATPDVPVDCILTKFIRTAMNKVKCPVYSVCVSLSTKISCKLTFWVKMNLRQ